MGAVGRRVSGVPRVLREELFHGGVDVRHQVGATDQDGAAVNIARKPVRSSNIKSVGYDAKNWLLHVEFHSGAVHEYPGVSPEEHTSFVHAPSAGKYFHAHLRDRENRKIA